ncbi:MAG: D-alanine--D-alanine ligase [bacterium]|nr:D-alanine--D-alanine ligase [bacterium]
MPRKHRVLLIKGGTSNEHTVSLQSAEMVAGALDANQFDCQTVTVKRNGKWKFENTKELTLGNALVEIQRLNIDIAFIMLHGAFGEDGGIQSVLKAAKIPFTGSEPEASTLAMNKAVSGTLFKANGFDTPDFVHIKKSDEKLKCNRFKFPAIIKPCHGGSSIKISFAENAREAWISIKNILASSDSVILQRLVKGREFTCGILDDRNGKPQALPPTEIIPLKGDFFDFNSKYFTGGSREITPPNLSPKWVKKIQNEALRAHIAFGCSGMSRSDFIFDGKKLYILEINTIPGMTKTSLLPQAAQAAGISFSKMLERIIQSCLQKS